MGDIIIAELFAIILRGAALSTDRRTAARGFQTAEFMLKYGLIDMIVERKSLKQTLSKLLDLHLVEREDSALEREGAENSEGPILGQLDDAAASSEATAVESQSNAALQEVDLVADTATERGVADGQ